VLRAMAKEINQRRVLRAEEARGLRPMRAPRTRIERQTVNFNAPVVPKARLVMPPVVKAPAPAPAKTVSPMAKAKSKAAKKLGNAKLKAKAIKPKAKVQTGRAKAKPKALSKTAQRAKKKQRR
jgi:hypothetical protein